MNTWNCLPKIQSNQPDQRYLMRLVASLRIAAEKLGIQVEGEKLDQIEKYCRLLWDWNEKINLTRHTDFDLFARRDLLDSWHLAQQLAEG